jgi:DEAD/DEAH box helicase domain-containing protein
LVATAPTALPWHELIESGRGEQLVAQARYGAEAAERAPLPEGLHPAVADALHGRGVDSLYAHQAEAFEAAREGHVIVTTGTASGKSLAFNLPVLHTLAADPRARALYLYPTKALAQDQARGLHALGARFLRPSIYDGDTPREERRAVRSRANLILTNPDMLHVGILPNHRSWGDMLSNLAWVVVDEAHAYRGVFGSHVANVLRRLRRLANAYGTEPRFERQVAMWNPPLLDEATGARASALSEAAEILATLVQEGARTICFLKSRRGIELILRFTRLKLEDAGRDDLAERIAPYRAGYTPPQRREIERRLAEGELLAVVATDALELGIDIGDLDAAVCVTFPGTVASLRQMWGRAGRRRTGLALYIAGDDALDQFFCRHPHDFLDRAVESAILDHESEDIHRQHLRAAAYEMPLSDDDAETLGPRWRAHAEGLVSTGELRERAGRFLPRGPGFPAAEMSLRSASPDSVGVVEVERGELIGSVEGARAHDTLHPGAVYLHMGQAYEVEELNLSTGRALVRPFAGDWYTQPKKETETFVETLLDRRDVLGVELSYGMVSVSEEVIAFQKKRISDHEVLDLLPVDLPERHFHTQALWYIVPEDLLGDDFPLSLLMGSLHAAEHGQIAVLPLIAMCDRWDIGGLSTNFHPQTGRPTIFVYDGHPGGIGLTRQGFHAFETLVADARRLIEECPCRRGCPSCVQSPKCGNLNEPLDKAGALELMRRMQAA